MAMHIGAHRIEVAFHGLTSPEQEDTVAIGSLCSLWRHINGQLAPVIGTAGMRALLRRSLLLARAQYDWLSPELDSSSERDSVEQLCDRFATRQRAELMATNLLLIMTFYRLLAGLIGESLADRLLEPVFSGPSADSSPQDPSP